ncbi:HDOD domain-containing protein [Marinobacter changyiensis]|uniref:HDOD domain-containing protein n=1 Tax=Marinobacter changyiensis TaxID=2604091 RepID=UPI00126454E1|nr:HDOD domain-containing protein [Marinobacter changyiensis]
MSSTQAWVNYLSKVELPVLANTLRRINELTDSTSSTVNQLAAVILNDAQLTSQVLRLSNTVFYNQTRTQVGTVSRAITLIGFDAVKSMAISSLIVDALLARSDRSQLLQCLARALHAAVQARCLLPKRNEQALEEVFIGALLMNIGELAFWSCDTQQADELEARLQRNDPYVESQKKVLRTTFAEITRELVEAWSLGPFIKDVVAAGQPNSKAASLVRHSVELARLSEKGWRGAEMDRVLDALAEEVGESTATVRDQVRINALEASKIANSLGIPQVGALLPDGSKSTRSQTPGVPPTDPVLELQILRELSHSLTNKPDINEVCQLVIDGIQKAVGMKRIALLMVDRSGNKLIPRKVAGPDTDPWREAYVVSRDGTGELGVLLPQKVCGIYHPARQTVTPGFDPWLCQVPALIGPLLANGRLVGMFYADNADIHAVPDAGQLTSFSHFVQHAQLCITLLSSH